MQCMFFIVTYFSAAKQKTTYIYKTYGLTCTCTCIHTYTPTQTHILNTYTYMYKNKEKKEKNEINCEIKQALSNVDR